MAYKTLISTDQLQTEMENSSFVIIDCRFELDNSKAGFVAYQQSHIPNAVYANLDHDLASEVTAESGRHPLPDMNFFQSKLGEWGIDSTKQVIVYDQFHGAFASRLWWMLRYLGHEAVAVLDGGYPKWEKENRPTESGIHQNDPVVFAGTVHQGWTVSVAEVMQNLNESSFKLIDSRAPDRFHGENETIDPLGGHIPGAVNYFFGNNITPEGVMKSPQELKQQFDILLENQLPDESVFYCGSGVSACQNLLAMAHAGLDGAKLYVGSWSEWSKGTNRPIATDSD